MLKTLIFIEGKEDIIFFEKYFQEDFLIISMHPSVGVELSKKNIPYLNTLDFYCKKGHQETLYFSKNILEDCRPLFNRLGSNKLKYSIEKTLEWHLRIYVYYMVSSIFIVNEVVQKYKVKNIITLSRKEPSKLNLTITSSDRVLGQLISRYCSSHGFKCTHIKTYDEDNNLKKIAKKIKYFVKYLTFNGMLFLYPLIHKNKSALLASDNTYNMPKLLDEVSQITPSSLPIYLNVNPVNILELIQGKSFCFFFHPSFILAKRKKEIIGNIKDYFSISLNSINYKNNNFIIFGADLKGLICDFISNQITNEIYRSYGVDKSMKKLLNIVKPKYVFSQHSLGDSHILGEYCRINSLPGIVIPHGTHPKQNDKLAKYAWTSHANTMINTPYPFVALQSYRDLKFLEAEKNISSKFIKTGPLLIARSDAKKNGYDNLRRKLFANNNEKRIILHASSPRAFYSFHPLIYETFDEYIKNINDTIKAIKDIPNIHLAVRYRSTDDLNVDDFKELLVPEKCYEVYAGGSFEEYLFASDLLLSYSSTTIQEALSNNIPVLQYDPDNKYEHFPGELLSSSGESNHLSSIYSVLNNEDLSPALNWWSKNHLKSDNDKIFLNSESYIRDNELSWLDQLS